MTARNRLPPWHEHFTLGNGREMLTRPVRPEDAAPLQGVFPLLGPEQIRQGFLHATAELGAEIGYRLTHPNPKSEIVLVAAEPLPPGEALIGGMARAAIVPGSRDAEFVILISRFVAGQGLARHLLRKLVKWARRKYLDRLCGDVLDDNEPMLQLACALGFRKTGPEGTPGLSRVVLDLDGAQR